MVLAFILGGRKHPTRVGENPRGAPQICWGVCWGSQGCYAELLFTLYKSMVPVSLATNKVIVFFKVKRSLHSYLRECLSNSKVWIIIVCMSAFFQVKIVFHERDKSVHNSVALVLFLRTTTAFQRTAKMLSAHFAHFPRHMEYENNIYYRKKMC